MRNYNEKQRDMLRSILPATNRRSVRFDAAVIKRQNRRATRMTLREWSTYDNAYDFEGHVYDTDDPVTGGCGYSQTITELMWERRQRDNVSALVRWTERLCETKFKDMDEWDRKAHFKRMLPDNLIGRHAWSHIDHLFPDTDDFNVFRFRGPYLTDKERRAQNKAAREAHIAEIADRLHEIIANGFHGGFNRDLDFETVPLAGLHDCERFATDNAYNKKIEKIIEKWENMMA